MTSPPTDPPHMVAQTIFLSRLSDELSSLGELSAGLQEAIHNLPLEHSTTDTRRVLQSADMLTQSLVCLGTALEGLSELPIAHREYDLNVVLRDVFLEDLRSRLAHGRDPENDPATHAGEVEIF
ncbi:hypothetical protein [Psychromarinibacter halotolerans]|uniref:Hpt domain-containing protein n=1 Tax=Psychromarinibacter halotolerans TaxID=1775175 RepID=A0ABV7GUG4_9RHOB|nr:hypothetical protein [Psychromarinibacter halotolerans]MDF0594535.1 hypothetical protein [Psychromarinibacter halotolerans]